MSTNSYKQMNNKDNMQFNSNNNFSKDNSTSSILSKKNYFDKQKLNHLINESLNENYKNENETKEVLNSLRAKYLPQSIKNKNNSILNNNHNMTYFNNDKILSNTNLFFSTYTDLNRLNLNSSKISTEKVDYYEANKLSILQSKNPYIANNDSSKLFQSTFSDLKDNNLSNFYESIKNKKSNFEPNENFKGLVSNLGNNNTNHDKDYNIDTNNNDKDSSKDKDHTLNKTYLNDYLSQENEKLKRINKNFELLMIPMIEYINYLNYYFSQNLIDVPNINQIIKNNNLSENYKPVNDLRSMLNLSKNNIVNITKNKKRSSVNKNNISNFSNISNIDKNNYSTRTSFNKRTSTFNIRNKDFDLGDYFGNVKPKIAERKSENYDKNIFKNTMTEYGGMKRAKTLRERLPTNFWLQNKKVKFIEINS
jgi:hypothetical protein